jgi:hypothetical protein
MPNIVEKAKESMDKTLFKALIPFSFCHDRLR